MSDHSPRPLSAAGFTRQLTAVANDVDVDVDTLLRLTTERIDALPRNRPQQRWQVLVAAAAVAAVVVGGAVLATRLHTAGPTPSLPPSDDSSAAHRPDGQTSSPQGTVRRPVPGPWACPQHTTLPVAQFEGEDPVRSRRPDRIPVEARLARVPRVEFVQSGAAGEIRYGLGDGRLTASTEVARVNGRWIAQSRTVCSGNGVDGTVPTTRADDLVSRPDAVPDGANSYSSDVKVVLIDTRPFYTKTGLLDAQGLAMAPEDCADDSSCLGARVYGAHHIIAFLNVEAGSGPVCEPFEMRGSNLRGRQLCAFYSLRPVETVILTLDDGQRLRLSSRGGSTLPGQLLVASASPGAEMTHVVISYTDETRRIFDY